MVLASISAWHAASADDTFASFESGQVRPLAVNGGRLFAVNTPDNRLEIYTVEPSGLTHVASVPVGLEPVAVAARTSSEVWVVNHLSDSVSVVDTAATPPRVVRTLLVGDEPRDIVFAGPDGNRAFITAAHRGQNIPFDPLLAIGSIGRTDVWVFDATSLGTTLGGTPLRIIKLFGDTPRALAVSPDGATVYAAVFHSGNRTTTIHEQVVCDGGAAASPCVVNGVTYPGGLPGPDTNIDGLPRPETGLIVKFNTSSGRWEDTLGRDWSNAVRFSLPDNDVFAIDAVTLAQSGAFSGVGTVLFNMTVNPVSGKVYVSNTEARNEVRFEGPGIFGGTSVRGHLHESRITVLAGTAATPRHLNKHIDYSTVPSPGGVADASLAIPLGMAVSSDGATLYVTAFGSDKIGVFDTAALENDTFVPSAADHVVVSGGGPSGMVLDEALGRLYVLTRFDNAVSIIDTATRTEVGHVPFHNPEPPSIVNGRRFLYDARLTSSNGEAACASCHVFGDLDSLAWDLGNPDATLLTNPGPFVVDAGNPPAVYRDFHPMKGPMTTQTLRGMANHGPMHWRGDRTGGNDVPSDAPDSGSFDEVAAFGKFNIAFPDLLGRQGPLTDGEMQAFIDFILQVMLPPNPNRALDNSLNADQIYGHGMFFSNSVSDGFANCNGCHTLDPGRGLFGTDGRASIQGGTQHFKTPHLRNLYQKVGMFGMPSVPFFNSGNNVNVGDQIRGFGFLHDGSVDTLFRFTHATVFNSSSSNPAGFAADLTREWMEQFLLAFDTDFAPIVGQQITLNATNSAVVGPRIDLLVARAGVGECQLAVKGIVAGEARGWYYRPLKSAFVSDRAAEGLTSDAGLRALATTSGQDLTYTCAPPGSGVRIGIDRDADGALDGDEIDAGSDPADPSSLPPGTMTCSGTASIEAAKIKIARNLDPAGDERLTVKGRWIPATLTPPIDPVANGFGISIGDRYGVNLVERMIPPGAPGWTASQSGTRWTFRDPSGTAASGITRVTIRRDRTGRFSFSVIGSGSFQVLSDEIPLRLLAVLGGPAQGIAGQCARRSFNAADRPRPRCAGAAMNVRCL